MRIIFGTLVLAIIHSDLDKKAVAFIDAVREIASSSSASQCIGQVSAVLEHLGLDDR